MNGKKVILNERIEGLEIEEKNSRVEQQAIIQTEQLKKIVEEVTHQNKADEFDDIRKFKQLYDEGIITEEEFNVKKRELLGL